MNLDEFKRGWHGGLPETPCGYGSKIDQTVKQREWLPRMVAKYAVHSMADIGAGDLNWMPLIHWPHPVMYHAYDLVPRRPGVYAFDIVNQVPEPVDMLVCLWVLNHLPDDQAQRAIDNLLASGSKYLVYTWWPSVPEFQDLGALESAVIRRDHKKNIDYEIRLVEC